MKHLGREELNHPVKNMMKHVPPMYNQTWEHKFSLVRKMEAFVLSLAVQMVLI